MAKAGRYGPYVTEVLESDAPKSAKPRTGSLLTGMTVENVTLDDALRILSLPRVVGTDPDGHEITAANGRYGPYLMRTVDGKADYRSLPDEESLFTVTLEQALVLYAAPRQRRGQARAAAAPLHELGADPTSGGTITLREGRYGPYVTDGTTNASLRKGDSPESLTPERAAELLAEKRAAGPAKKASAKKAPAKKVAAKAPAKKAPAKIAAAAKAPANKAPAKIAAAAKAPAKKAPAKKAPAKKAAGTKAPAKKAPAKKAPGTAPAAAPATIPPAEAPATIPPAAAPATIPPAEQAAVAAVQATATALVEE
jgi:DNA topoisomerase-1